MPSSLTIIGAFVTKASSCGSADCWLNCPLSTFGRTSSTRRPAPHLKRWGSKPGDVSLPCSCIDFWRAMGPASIFATVYKIVMPVSVSPAAKARCTGDAPRQRGSSDGCKLSVPSRGALRNRRGRYCPYAAVTQMSGSKASNCSKNSSSRALAGARILSTPRDAANSCTGVFVSGMFLPLPTFFGGCVTTALSSKPAWDSCDASCNARKTSSTQSGEPRKTTRAFRAGCPASEASEAAFLAMRRARSVFLAAATRE
mmetsp:Transcript_6780/g.16873  ORF Transcript_6780/g.16873 Transcript_6780/m.16873 type:complete len:256 (+) Transcript_6780:515-1282(+)